MALKNDPNEFFIEQDGAENYEKKVDGSWKTGLSPNEKKGHIKPGQVLNPKGRELGSKNKKTLRMELIDSGKYTPAQFLASVVNDENANLGQRIRAAEASAKFYDPSLASIEMHTDEDHEAPFQIIIGDNVTAEDVLTKLEEVADNETKDKDE